MMCGRYVTRDQAAIERYFNISSHQFQLTDRYNVAPSTTVPVVRSIDGERVMSGMHWGLIPFWAKDQKIAHKTINARAETVASKPALGKTTHPSHSRAYGRRGKGLTKSSNPVPSSRRRPTP